METTRLQLQGPVSKAQILFTFIYTRFLLINVYIELFHYTKRKLQFLDKDKSLIPVKEVQLDFHAAIDYIQKQY